MSGPRKKRVRFFLGCEGKSEKAYGQFIQDIALEQGLFVTFDFYECGGGDPFVIAKKAIRECKSRDSVDYPFTRRFLLIDRDRLADMPHNDVTKLLDFLIKNNFFGIWQDPDHEGFLLRHFEGHESDIIQRGQSLKVLQNVWTGYKKGMTRRDYINSIMLDDVKRAASKHSDLMSFLQAVGLVKPED